MRINSTKSSEREVGRETKTVKPSHSGDCIIFLWEGNHCYCGLAVLLIESDFSKLSMLDFDELMN